MTGGERRLLWVLLATLFLCAVSGVAYAGLERTAAAKTSVARYREALSRLPLPAAEADELDTRLRDLRAALESGPRPETKKPLPAFAAEVRSALTRHRIDPDQYQIVGASGEEAVEFRLRCAPLGFFKFLKEAAGKHRDWDFPVISIRTVEGDAIAEIVLRAAYAK
jgi:hypothetical protein